MAGRKRRGSEQGAKAPKNPGLESGELVGLGVQVSRRHYELLEERVKEERRTKRVIIETALEMYFKQVGAWPGDKQAPPK